MKVFLPEELEISKKSEQMADLIWNFTENWNYFPKHTIGKQIVRAADSVSLNIAEGFGRYYFKENKMFCYYARGSLYETKSCLNKAFRRKLIDEKAYHEILKLIDDLIPMLNTYIKKIG